MAIKKRSIVCHDSQPILFLPSFFFQDSLYRHWGWRVTSYITKPSYFIFLWMFRAKIHRTIDGIRFWHHLSIVMRVTNSGLITSYMSRPHSSFQILMSSDISYKFYSYVFSHNANKQTKLNLSDFRERVKKVTNSSKCPKATRFFLNIINPRYFLGKLRMPNWKENNIGRSSDPLSLFWSKIGGVWEKEPKKSTKMCETGRNQRQHVRQVRRN